jgi:hypothetical protein
MNVTRVQERPGIAIRSQSQWPNTIVFPKELGDAIPVYGSRALIFDAVSGTPHTSPVAVSGMLGEEFFDFGPRARAELTVHESGKLNGAYNLLVDLDSPTMRALGEFFVDLADRAERKE